MPVYYFKVLQLRSSFTVLSTGSSAWILNWVLCMDSQQVEITMSAGILSFLEVPGMNLFPGSH